MIARFDDNITELRKDLAAAISSTINQYAKKYGWYYLLVHSWWEDDVLRTRQVILTPEYLAARKLDATKINMLTKRLTYSDSMLFYINNKKEQFELLSALPHDIPGLISTPPSELVARSQEEFLKIIRN